MVDEEQSFFEHIIEQHGLPRIVILRRRVARMGWVFDEDDVIIDGDEEAGRGVGIELVVDLEEGATVGVEGLTQGDQEEIVLQDFFLDDRFERDFFQSLPAPSLETTGRLRRGLVACRFPA